MNIKSEKDEINNIKNEVHKLQEQSLALELLKDYKKQNKRQFIIILVILSMFTALLGYTIYLLNDIGTETTTQEVTQDNTNGSNNFIGNNGDITNGETNN